MSELSFTERRDWLRLARTRNVGPVAFRDLLARFGTPAAALQALPDMRLRRPPTIPPVDIIEAELDAHERAGVRLIASCEDDYPAYLRALDPAPPIISVLGRTELLHRPCIAIVGSRNASAIGQKFAAQISSELGEAGYVVVSGLARGIDARAHEAALDAGTVAVLGGGPDHVYPRDNAELYADIAARGALVSESPLGYRATARDFPRRNRIISGLSLGVVVVEAAERSGTLITARYALEQNREVMAAPGSPLDPRTKGCNRLIRQGAHLIEGSRDIIDVVEGVRPLEILEPPSSYTGPAFDAGAAAPAVAKARQTLSSLASPTPTARDDLIRASGLPIQIATAALLEMELDDDIHVEPDGRVSLSL